MKAGEERRAEIFSMKCLRRAIYVCVHLWWIGLRLWDVKKEVDKEEKRKKLIKRMDQSFQNWFRHMEKMDEGRLTKVFTELGWMRQEGPWAFSRLKGERVIEVSGVTVSRGRWPTMNVLVTELWNILEGERGNIECGILFNQSQNNKRERKGVRGNTTATTSQD